MSLLCETADKNSMTQPDLFEALDGFYAAEREQDLFRAGTWLRHLEFLRYMQALNTGCSGDLSYRERGNG